MESIEKKFRVRISFDKKESNIFGGMSNSETVLVVSESVKDRVIDEFNGQNTTISVDFIGEGGEPNITRHINCRNILYIDVSEIGTTAVSGADVK